MTTCKPRRVVLACLLVILTGTQQVSATDPAKHCNPYDKFAKLLAGPPHHERQALVLRDIAPNQGHRLELFMNSGEGARHSYTLLRIRRGRSRACIVSAGTVSFKSRDEEGRDHLVLSDENDPETLDLITCGGRYVITQEFLDGTVCKLLRKYYGATRFMVSYGTIQRDRRDQIPWPR